MPFVSSYYHNLDAKKRLFIPVKYRDGLGESFYVMPGPSSNLYLYPREAFEEIAEQYRKTHRNPTEQMVFFSSVSEVTADNQGRITLDGRYIEHAELTKEVAVVGGGRRVEIWPLEKYKPTIETAKMKIDFSEDIDW